MKAIERPQFEQRFTSPPGRTELWRDELNFAEWPLAILTDRPDPNQKTLVFRDRIYQNGQPLERTLTLTGSDAFGLPLALDEDVLLGLIQLTRLKNGFGDSTVEFTLYEYLKLLDWQNKGQNYDRLRESLLRWAGVTVIYDNAWWNNDRKTWERTRAFHILEDLSLKKVKNPHTVGPQEPSFATWNTRVFKSLQAGNLKTLDWQTYSEFRLSGSKRAYRFLTKRWWKRPRLSFDLREYACDKLGLSKNYDTGQLKRKLKPFHEELQAKNILKTEPDDRRFKKLSPGKWRIELERASRQKAKPVEVLPGSKADTIVAALLERGIQNVKAIQLRQTFPVEQIKEKIELFDWRKDKSELRENPAGWLVKAIEDNYPLPDGFETTAQREAHQLEREEKRRALDKAKDDKERRETEVVAQKRAPILAYLSGLTAEQLASLEAQAITKGSAFFQRLAKGDGPAAAAVRQNLLDEHVLTLLAGEMESLS